MVKRIQVIQTTFFISVNKCKQFFPFGKDNLPFFFTTKKVKYEKYFMIFKIISSGYNFIYFFLVIFELIMIIEEADKEIL